MEDKYPLHMSNEIKFSSFWKTYYTPIDVGDDYSLHELFMLKVLRINKQSLIT
jgi:hypothetical protein